MGPPGSGMTHLTSHLLQARLIRIDRGGRVLALLALGSCRLEPASLLVPCGMAPQTEGVRRVILLGVQLDPLLGFFPLAGFQYVKGAPVR